MDCTRFASSCCEISGGNGPSPHPEIQALRWQWQNTDIPVFQEITHRTSSKAGGIVKLEGFLGIIFERQGIFLLSFN
jgi:hypothetical protein